MSKDDLVAVVAKNAPGIVGTLGLVVAGALAVVHDSDDIGKLDHIHHWLIGIIAMVVGVVLLGFQVLFMLRELDEKERGFK